LIQPAILSLLAPVVIYISLQIFNSITISFILFHGVVCVIIPLIDFTFIKKLSVKEIFKLLGFNNFIKGSVSGILIGSLFFIIIYLFFTTLNKYVINTDQINNLLIKWHLNNEYLYPFLFMMIFANSFLEEIYWRGYIFHKFKSKTNIRNVILLTSLFYCSYHFITTINLFSVIYGLIFSSVVFSVGVFWGYMRYKFDSIYISLLSHLLADLGIMVIYFKYLLN